MFSQTYSIKDEFLTETPLSSHRQNTFLSGFPLCSLTSVSSFVLELSVNYWSSWMVLSSNHFLLSSITVLLVSMVLRRYEILWLEIISNVLSFMTLDVIQSILFRAVLNSSVTARHTSCWILTSLTIDFWTPIFSQYSMVPYTVIWFYHKSIKKDRV